MTPHHCDHECFCCEDCDHDGQGTCPVPEIKTIPDLKKFQGIVKVTGCRHQKSIRNPHAPAASEIKTCFDLKEYGESIRNQTLDIILKDLSGRSCIGAAMERIAFERGSGWLREQLIETLRTQESPQCLPKS